MTAIQQKSIRILGLLLISISLFAQEASWRKIGLEEGLPTAALNNMVQGPEGFWWISSEGAGLIRYDGYRFEVFFNEEFPIIEEVERSWRNQRLYWHDGKRLAEFDGVKLKVYESDFSIQDLQDIDGSLFVASEQELLFWNGDTLLPKADLPQGFQKLGCAEGMLFAQTDSGLYRWQNRWIKTKPGLELISGKPDGLWTGHSIVPVSLEPSWEDWRILQTDDTWMGSGQGSSYLLAKPDSILFHYQIENYRLYPRYLPYPKSLSFGDIRSLYCLKRTAVLITDKGLFFHNRNLQYTVPTPFEVLSIGAGYWGASDGLHHRYREVKTPIETNGLVLSIEELGGETFVATESGLYRLKGGSQKLSPTPVQGFVFSLKARESLNEIWAAASSGIWRLSEGQWELVRSAEDINFASIFSINASYRGLWFASYTQGLWFYDGEEWEHYPRLANLALDSIGLSAVYQFEDVLVLGTRSDGLYLVDLDLGSYQHYTVQDLDYAEVRVFFSRLELESSSDDDFALWIGTNKGLVSLIDVQESKKAGESGRIHFWGGPVNPEGVDNQVRYLATAGSDGIFQWEQGDWWLFVDSVKLGLLGVEVLADPDGKASDLESYLPFSFAQQAQNLDHDQNYLRFRFSARSLFYPELIQYRYRLQGQKSDWTYIGSSREALFTDLKAGDYSLEVEARYPWSGWQMKSESYPFTIHQAIWRTWWFWTLAGILALALAFFYLRERFQRQQERLKLENDLLEMERKALRLQMNPHFIFNALDSISSFIFKKDPKMAVRYLNNFAKLMRLTLESSMEHIHPVETEVSILKNYLELEKLRFSDKFDYEIEVDEELDYTIGLPPMLIQPHVENAILHGLKPKEGFGFLKISFELDDEVLTCTIEDDGIGRAKARELPNKKAHRSMATQINRDRIDLLRASIDEVIELKIIDKFNQQGEASGTKVIIRLPAQEL